MAGGLGFGLYTLWIAQMTMLHGDEGQYLLVTQSLLRDGDLDLSNVTDDDIAEFHVLTIGIHETPSAPEGRIHSRHPVGLSASMLLPYEIGRRLWTNPRLVCALAMSALTAAILALIFLWLRHMGIGFSAALATTVVAATTTPLLLFSTQIYPELPAVAITLVTLLHLPPLPSRHGPQPWPRPLWQLMAVSAGLGTLPFLHPRYAPLAALLYVLTLWQARRDRRALASVLGPAFVALAGLIWHNLVLTGDDWLGHFRPGNAWETGAVDPDTWWISIPGHWLHQDKGLALHAPVFFVAVVAGVSILLRRHRRQLVLLASLYAVTAAVNGVHPDWTFGYCLPARFLLTALPALLLPMAVGFDAAARRPWLALGLAGTLAVSWDIARSAVQLPELAYKGLHLGHFSLTSFYPVAAHGFRVTEGLPPAADLAFWAAAALAVVGVSQSRLLPWRFAPATALVLAALAPAFFRWQEPDRMADAVTPFLRRTEDGKARPVATAVERLHARSTGRRDSSGVFEAQAGDGAGMLASYYMPLQRHGLYRVSVSGTSNSAPQRAIVSHRRTLPVVQPWSYYQTVVMPPADSVRRQISYYAEGNSLGYLMLPYTGQGHYQIGAVRQDYYPQHLPLVRSELGRYPFEGSGEGWLLARAHLEPGRYVVRYRLAGGAAETLVERKPVPVRLGVLVAGERDIGLEEVRDWYEHDRSVSTTIADPTPVAPQSGALVAPWWTSIPWVGDSAYELVFRLPQARAVLFLYAYEGDADLRLRDAVVYRQTLQEMP